MCVLQFLPCQPSILERMKQPWRIWAVAADLFGWPEDPGCHRAMALRQLPWPPLPPPATLLPVRLPKIAPKPRAGCFQPSVTC